jgi:hypothetical protein
MLFPPRVPIVVEPKSRDDAGIAADPIVTDRG